MPDPFEPPFKGSVPEDEEENKTVVITVRMPKSLHIRIKKAAKISPDDISMNVFCRNAIEAAVEATEGPIKS